MNSKLKLILWILVAVILFCAAIFAYNSLSGMYSPQIQGSKTPVKSSKAEDFTVVNGNGERVSLSQMTGKGVVVNFWASWCPPCKAELPDFEKLYKEIGDEVEFMIVNMTDGMQETVEKGKSHIEENGYTFPVYYDTEQSAAMAYGVTSIPQTYFIDKNGNVVSKANGMIDYETLKQGIEMIK